MKKTISEQQVLHELDIPDFRHMTKDKIIAFASAMPYMEPEVAKEALHQFPNFSKLGADMVNFYKEELQFIADKDEKNTIKALELNEKILDILDRQLNRRFITPRQRNKIIDSLLEVSKNITDLDKSRKDFLLRIFKTAGQVSIGIMVIVGAALGINFRKKS